MTQLELAKKGALTPEMITVAEKEGVDPQVVLEGVADGSIVIPANINHKGLDPCGIGKGLRTKVNANIGTSSDIGDIKSELEKVQASLDAKADTIMDLSTGGDIPVIRRAILERCPIPLGTVPIYQAGIAAIKKRGSIVKMTADDMFEAIEFPQLATKYEVMGVPKTVINDELEFEGAAPEDHFVAQLMTALHS